MQTITYAINIDLMAYIHTFIATYLPTYLHTYIHTYINIYRVSQEECTRLREGVPYVKVYRYNPKSYVQS